MMSSTHNTTPDTYTETVRIERMAYGSAAVAHLESGKTVFVEGAVVGDVVRIALTEDKPTFARARAIDLVEASNARVDAHTIPCPYTNLCGGCPWAALAYPAQLEAKRALVVDALQRTAHFEAQAAEQLVGVCVPSKREWGYRNKVELAVHTDPHSNRLELGYFADRSHSFCSIDSCAAAHKNIAATPKALRGALRYLQGSQNLGLFRVGVRGSLRTGNVEVALWTPPGAFPRAAVAKTLSSALKATSIVRVMADEGKTRKVKGVEVLTGKGMWEEELTGNRFLTSAPSFFQVNTAGAETLVVLVCEGLELQPGDVVADLYAGGGTFTLPLARTGADVIAVEAAGTSVRDLRRNAGINQVEVEVIGGDALRELQELGDLDALVVDPPRAGLGNQVVDAITAAHPARVAYVSCDPITWARDVQLFERAGYQLLRATPVDMFPQTFHVETVSLFQRLG